MGLYANDSVVWARIYDSRFVRTSGRITVLTFLLNTNISHVIKVLGAKF